MAADRSADSFDASYESTRHMMLDAIRAIQAKDYGSKMELSAADFKSL
jgi:hypothetical protein